MPTIRIAIGYPTSILQNISYALPIGICRVQSLVAIQASIDNSTFAALTGAETTGVETSAGWIKCTTGNTTVICDRMS